MGQVASAIHQQRQRGAAGIERLVGPSYLFRGDFVGSM